MKNLIDYISDYKKPERWGLWTFEEFCDINNLGDNNIPQRAIDFYYSSLYKFLPDRKNGTYNDWVNESLTSHNRKKLIDKLKTVLGEYYIDTIEIKEKPMYVGVFAIEVSKNCPIIVSDSNTTFELSDNKLSNEIYNILQFYNYYITVIDKSVNSYIISFEPLYTESANKVIKQNGGIVYHVTNRNNLKTIFRTGLRPRVGKTRKNNGYRYFSDRIFLIGHSDDIVENIKSVLEDKGYDENDTDKYVILKIDLTQHDINLWFDDASAGKMNVYTLTAIPSKLITEITLNDLK